MRNCNAEYENDNPFDNPFENEGPPIGLRPKEVWLSFREEEIMDAMERYRHAKKDIPVEWIDELLWVRHIITKE